MQNFELVNPVRVIFGKDQLYRLPELLQEHSAKRVLLAYGGGSVKRNGLFDQIMKTIGNEFELFEFGGIQANPEFDVLMQVVEFARAKNIDFILAVGGGSVIDGVKFVSGAIGYKGDPWDVLEQKEGCAFNTAVPFGTILTIPATGSEVNSGAVISRKSIEAKRVMGGPLFFPKFSFCDPSVISTLPKRQLVNGIVDAFVHTLEQYITFPSGNLLQEREAEAILSTLIDVKEVVNKPRDYNLAANFMLSASHALNGNLRTGVPTDWVTHMIGHEFTAKFGIDHARTLAIVLPRLWEHQFDRKKESLAQYGRRIFGLEGNDEEVAQAAIRSTEFFFNELGIETKLSSYTDDYLGFDHFVADLFRQRNWVKMGETQSITPQDIQEIVKRTFD